MAEYRNRTTGEVKTQGQWRKLNRNVSMPRIWKAATLDALNLDPVLSSPAAVVGPYQVSVRDGVEQDAEGNWVEKHVARDMFADYTDDDGVTHTKAEQEAAYQATLDEGVSQANRNKRNTLLAETDYLALTDNTMDDITKAYRQALRDITTHANWPHLEESDWPVKP